MRAKKLSDRKLSHSIDACMCVDVDIINVLSGIDDEEYKLKEHYEKMQKKECHIYKRVHYCFGDER